MMGERKSSGLGMELPPEIKDDKTGRIAKLAGHLQVGQLPKYRAIAINFDDHGAIYYMSPLMARRLGKELLAEAEKLTQ